MTDKSWNDWYDTTIKKYSKNCEDELENCKSMLESYMTVAKHSRIKPSYLEELPETLKEDDAVDADEKVIEDALNYLLVDMRFTLPVYDWVKTYIAKKDRLDLFKKFDEVLGSFSKIFYLQVTPMAAESRTEMLEISNMPESEDKTRMILEFYDREVFENLLLERLGLRVLGMHLAYTNIFARGAFSLVLFEPPYCGMASGALLRSALEVALKGMLLQHLVNPKSRLEVKSKRWWRTPFDTVLSFLRTSENKARNGKVSIETVISDTFSEIMTQHLNIHDVLHWLNEWGVFKPLPDAEEKLGQYYKELSEEIHGYQKTLAFGRRYRTEIRLDIFLGEMTGLLDFVLLGVLNTANNLRRTTLENLMDLKAYNPMLESERSEKTACEYFLEITKNAGLKRRE